MTTVYSERIDGWTCELHEDVSIRQAVQDVTGIVATARPDGSLQAYALVPPSVLAWLLKPLFADLEASVEARVRRELEAAPADPADVLGYGHGLEVCDQQEGWVVATGINGEEFHPVALFFDKERAEQYCELQVDDGCGGRENVAFDACASEAVIVRDRIIVANDYTIESCTALRERVARALTPDTSLPETAEKDESNG